jgi:hypothetical protein
MVSDKMMGKETASWNDGGSDGFGSVLMEGSVVRGMGVAAITAVKLGASNLLTSLTSTARTINHVTLIFELIGHRYYSYSYSLCSCLRY